MNNKAKSSPLTKKSPVDSTPPLPIEKEELTIIEARKLLPENMKHLDLNLKEYKFLAVYCSNGFDAEEACKKAGYLERTRAGYKAIAYSLLNRKEITEAIKLFIDTVIQPYKDRLELELLNTYYKRATYSISYFYDNTGNPLPIKEINKDYLCCIDDIKYVKNGNTTINAYQLPNRDLALQALYRFITGQDLTSPTLLPEEAKKKVQTIYQTIMKNNINIKPKTIKKMTKSNNND